MTFRFHRIGLFVVGLLLGLGLIAGGFILWRLARSRGETMGSSGTAPTVNRVVYLAPSARPDLWRAASDGSQQRQLTQSGGKVYDYAVWSDGSRLVYSAANELGGLSLWTLNRDGGDVTLVLDCGADRCFERIHLSE